MLHSLVAQVIKHLPALQKTRVRSLGGEDPLEKGMATHCSILAWEIHGQRNLAGYGLWGGKESDLVTKQQLLSNILWKFPSFLKYPLINPLQQIHHFGCWPQRDDKEKIVKLLWG